LKHQKLNVVSRGVFWTVHCYFESAVLDLLNELLSASKWRMYLRVGVGGLNWNKH